MRFLCLYDFSEHASIALQTAVFLAGKIRGSDLTLFHVCDEAHFEERKNALKETVGNISAAVRATYFLDSGDFFERFESYVKLYPPDLLIFCTRGVHGWRQQLFGPNSVHLCSLCPSPALILNTHPFESDEGVIVWNANYELPADETLSRNIMTLFSRAGRFRWLIHAVDDNNEAPENALRLEKQLLSYGADVRIQLEPKSLPSLGLAGDIIRFAAERDARMIVCGIKEASLPTWRSDAERLINNEAGLPVLLY